MLNPIRSKILDFIVESNRFCGKEIKGKHEICTFANMFVKNGKLAVLFSKEKIYTIAVIFTVNGKEKAKIKAEGNFNDAYDKITEDLQEVLNVIDNR